MEKIRPQRIYTHFKGGTYLVLSVAEDSTNSRKGNRSVVYVSLTHGTVKCRDLSEFAERVTWPDGIERARFVLKED